MPAGDLDTEPGSEQAGKLLAMDSRKQPTVCWAFRGTSGSKAIGLGLDPCRRRPSDRIRVHNLYSSLGTPFISVQLHKI
jgi:hypothetical protein